MYSPSCLATETDSISNDPQVNGVIYISNDVHIYGVSHIYIKKVPPANSKTSISGQAPKKSITKTFTEQAAEKKKKADLKIKRIQMKLDSVAKQTFHSSPVGNELILCSQKKSCGVASAPGSFVFKGLAANISDHPEVPSFDNELIEHQFYTSFSNLQLCKFRSTSLRAPPHNI